MKALSHRPNWPLLVLLVAMCGFTVYQSQAVRPQPPAPAVVATVDIVTLFQGLSERGSEDKRLTQLAEGLDAEGQRRREALDLLVEELELFAPGSKQHDELAAQITRDGYDLQAYLDFAVRKLDLHKAMSLRRLYARIKTSIDEVARLQGYDFVMVDDSVVGLPLDAGEVETMRQISARRLLFAAERTDVTQEVIAHMNQAFALGQP